MRSLARAVTLALALALAWAAPARAQQAADPGARADRVAAEVAALRGLAIRKPIRRGVMNKAQIRERLLERVDQEYTDAEIRGEALVLKRLGLIPADADYLELMISLLTDQIAGFYDPWNGTLYIASWTNFGGDMVMAHEIGHALQDQHFDLDRFMKAERDNADATAARQALVEGDGTAMMIEHATRDAGVTPWGNAAFVEQMAAALAMEAGGMKSVPLAVREALIFPYLGGLSFVAHFRKHHPWRRIDAIYGKPPLSTEHVLHPDKYLSYERPVAIRSALPALLAGYQVVYESVTGEKGFELFLRQHGVAADMAAIAAAGWGGDRIAVYAPPGHASDDVRGTVAISYSVWDEEADAIEFFEALTRSLPGLAQAPGRERDDGVIEQRLPDGALVAAQRRGDAVVIVIGAPPASSDDLLAAAWTWQVVRP